MNKPDDLPEYVYVAEAYKDGEMIERIIHVIHDDAKEDIETTTNNRNPDKITISRERLYTGQLYTKD